MKKRFLTLFFIFIFATTALAATQYTLSGVSYPIVVNGQPMAFTDAVPMNYQGRTMLPLRAVSEALDVPIEWDGKQVNIDTIDLDKLKDSCVLVEASGKDQKGEFIAQGSGVLIDYDEVLTCFHEVNNASTFKIYYDDSVKANACKLTDTAENKDAAVLTPPYKDVKPVKIGDSDEVSIGDKVYVVSCPKNDKNVVASGKVLQFASINGISGFTTSALTKEGSSGGACFNCKGELIGIVQSGDDVTRSDIVPINAIRESLAS
ncbi:MAG: trypsin-like peptidase domain-containing protein [Bacillota bacterium]|nr:trypsin-like peptidase domain-containing protein [Bacillota bacterium]